ncbi:MAG: dephospho-CoA kinase [Fimbriimonadaceae bacterium]|nr:dephospho-CoA kinase [Fimbriimonadaceae bacterium]
MQPAQFDRRIAITGGIAEGKSTVMAMIREAGYPVQDADALARHVADQPDVRAEIAARLGLEADFTRDDLRRAVAQDPGARETLNALIHPRVRALLRASGPGFHEVPLLYEAGMEGDYDAVWVVMCGEAEQRRRLAARGMDPALMQVILAAQWPTSQKAQRANAVIRTDHPIESVREEVLARLRALSNAA